MNLFGIEKVEYLHTPMNYIGGKYKLLSQLLPLFPEADIFIDVFTGGLTLPINTNYPITYANDKDSNIIKFYKYVQDTSTNKLIKEIENKIEETGIEKNKENYYKYREYFNNKEDTTPVEFFVLLCHSYNNAIRYNSKGKINSSAGFGSQYFTKNMRANLIKTSNILQHKNIYFSDYDFNDYTKILLTSIINKNTFIYCDPPYLISNANYNKTAGDWNLSHDKSLWEFLDNVNSIGAKFALSNCFENKGIKFNELIEWSSKYNVHHLKMSYYNHFNARNRQKDLFVDEVLITNY